MTKPPLINRMLNALLDPTIVFSFDRTGFKRHSAEFREQDLDVEMDGRVCLVTGANSGIGRATATALAARGATTWLLCRDRSRGEEAREAIREATGNLDVHLGLLDLSDLDSVRRFADTFKPGQVDVLVKNAGVLPDTLQRSPQGFELTYATNVLGHYLLTELMRPKLRAAEGARIIAVASGGMYTQQLNLAKLVGDVEPFDGVNAYAQTKRAQVILSELWAEELAAAEIDCYAMHPGWADTPAVRSSLPRFHSVTKAILRTPEEGADTIVWLSVCKRITGRSGEFWFDREARDTHFLGGTRERPEDRAALWKLCREACGL